MVLIMALDATTVSNNSSKVRDLIRNGSQALRTTKGS